ncbi:MAG TPA: serine/threonine-protein kinase, partial [Polyangiaceae bacterium]
MAKVLRVRPGSAGPLASGDLFLGKLEVRALLGKGGHAWVYECFDRFLRRTVAVKVIKTLREVGRDLGRRAQAEAVVLASMTHPNLVRVMDAGIADGLVYIVMEKLEGRTLRHTLMSTGRLSVREALMIALQIADGMQAAHDHGVIHRDLKPENIFIEPPNRVKVLDFGIAKVLGGAQVTTQKDRLQGTVFYMSPEQLQGLSATPGSDVFALGTMLFEMLYAHPLTLGGALPSNEHVAWMQLYRDPPRLETLDPRIPRYVGKLVGRAIVKLPQERYQTMRELREATFQALERHLAEHAARPGEQPRDLTTEPIGPLDVPEPPLDSGSHAKATIYSPSPQAGALPEPPTRTAPQRPVPPRTPRPKRRWRLRKETVVSFTVGFATVAVLFGARSAWLAFPHAMSMWEGTPAQLPDSTPAALSLAPRKAPSLTVSSPPAAAAPSAVSSPPAAPSPP